MAFTNMTELYAGTDFNHFYLLGMLICVLDALILTETILQRDDWRSWPWIHRRILRLLWITFGWRWHIRPAGEHSSTTNSSIIMVVLCSSAIMLHKMIDGKSVVYAGFHTVQFISIPDERYDEHRRSSGFMKEYIFPGGCLPSLSRLTTAMAASSRLW